MKTLSFVLLLIASVAFVLTGCSDKSSLPVTPTEKPFVATKAVALGKGSPALHSVTGNANIWLQNKMCVMIVNAQLYEDGSVKGQFNLENTSYNPKAHMHGEVVALKFYENYTFSNGVSGPTALCWWREMLYDGLKGKYFATFVVDEGRDANGIVHDWTGPTTDPYDAVVDLTPQDIVNPCPQFFVAIDVGNVTIH